jgi:hypothetical protein
MEVLKDEHQEQITKLRKQVQDQIDENLQIQEA